MAVPTRAPMPMMDRVEEAQPVTHVRVVNNNNFEIRDRFNNEEFVFSPGAKLVIPRPAAQHIFGLDMDPKEQMLYVFRRMGWNTPQFMTAGDWGQARMFYDNISISPVYMKLVEMPPEPDFVDAPPALRPGRPTTARYKGAPDRDQDPAA